MTNDSGPITPAYVLTAIGFWFVAVPAALYLLGRLMRASWHLTQTADRAIGRRLTRHIGRALDHGDTTIRDATDAMWAARQRPSVPRRLEERRTTNRGTS